MIKNASEVTKERSFRQQFVFLKPHSTRTVDQLETHQYLVGKLCNQNFKILRYESH